MTASEKIQIDDLTSSMIVMLCKNECLSLKAAMRVVYNSDTMRKLENTDTGLYTYGSLYLYEMLEAELATGVSPVEP